MGWWHMRLVVLVLLAAFTPFLPALSTEPAPVSSTKRVEIDKTAQLLTAFEGERVVIQTRISSGKWDRSTPVGDFEVLGKERMHYSSRYNNAPMPYSVRINGHVFIHGYKDVPDFPASHGCIRVPLGMESPARQFFEWVDVGTPVRVFGKWEKPEKKKPAAN